MRVAVLSDKESTGGAAVAASRLARSLADAGVDIVRLVGLTEPGPRADLPARLVGPRLRDDMVLALLRRVAPAAARRAAQRLVARRLATALAAVRPDVVNVHNLHAVGWGPDMVRTSRRRAVTVWTLHDMWSFTGRCTHSDDCERFTSECDATCPTPHEYPELEPRLIRRAFRSRARLLAGNGGLVAVSPSGWLADRARRGLWRNRRVEVIRHGIPLDRFLPLPRDVARQALGLPVEGTVLLSVAPSLADPHKGAGLLGPALSGVTRPNITVVTVGSGAPEFESMQTRHLGSVFDDRTLALAYNAADVLIHPSSRENLPLAAVEALACGTPIVAFPVGGVPEVVRPGFTGWLTRDRSVESLAATIRSAIDQISAGSNLRASCREAAERDYSDVRQAALYLKLFDELVSTR